MTSAQVGKLFQKFYEARDLKKWWFCDITCFYMILSCVIFHRVYSTHESNAWNSTIWKFRNSCAKLWVWGFQFSLTWCSRTKCTSPKSLRLNWFWCHPFCTPREHQSVPGLSIVNFGRKIAVESYAGRLETSKSSGTREQEPEQIWQMEQKPTGESFGLGGICMSDSHCSIMVPYAVLGEG